MTMEQTFELSPQDELRVDVTRVGTGGYPVVIVDNFYRRPEAVRAFALGLPFGSARALYPGVDAFCKADTRHFYDRIEDLCNPVFPVPMRLEKPYLPDEYVFSIITQPLDQFLPAQRVPHTDPWRLAAVLYLNPPEQCRGGTGIYRHRSTGLEWFPGSNPAARRPAYAESISKLIDGGRGWQQIRRAMEEQKVDTMEALTRLIYAEAKEQPAPIRGSTPQWELLLEVPMKFNRLVLYPGCLFHAGHAEEGWFGEELATRRLTQNIFICWPKI